MLYLVAFVARLGWIADYFSRAVLVGYIHGIVVVLVIGQLGKLLGLSIDAADPIPQLAEVAQASTRPAWPPSPSAPPRAKGPLLEAVETAGLTDRIGAMNLYPNIEAAVVACARKTEPA